MERWCGKTAVVTGASAGIGAAIAVSLADVGLQVVGLARRAELIDKLNNDVTGKGKIHSLKCNVADTTELTEAFKRVDEEFGGTDILINNAGAFFGGTITDVSDLKISDELILMTIDVNFRSVVICTRHAIQSMKKKGIDGHVIFLNSVVGHYLPVASEFNVYPSTKHAITAFVKSLNAELTGFDSKIKITSISPGLVKTDMAAQGASLFPSLETRDIADIVVYILSTPPRINIKEITITPVPEKIL